MKHTLHAYHKRKRPRGIALAEYGLLFAFAGVLCDGTYNAFAKGLTGFLSPVSLLVASEALSALFVILAIGIVPLIGHLRKIRRKTLIFSVVVGLLNSALAPYLWFVGLTQTTAVNSSILNASSIIYSVLLYRYFLGETISVRQGVGALIVMAGVLIVSLGASTGMIAMHQGDALILLAVGIFAVGTMLYKKYLTHIDPEVALFLRNATGVATMLVPVLLVGHSISGEIHAFPSEKLLLLVSFAFFSRFLSLSFLYGALNRLPATAVALVNNASPLAGMFFAVTILGERIFPYQGIGAVLMIAGLMISELTPELWSHSMKKVSTILPIRLVPEFEPVLQTRKPLRNLTRTKTRA